MSKNKPPNAKPRFATLSHYFRTYKHYLIFGGISVLGTNALMLVVPYITKLVFDMLEAKKPSGEILNYILLGFGLAIIAGVFRFLMRRTIIWMSRRLEYDLRSDIFNHLLRLSPSYYHQTRTGDTMARITSDLEAVRMMIGPGIMHIANTLVSSVIAISFMFYLSPQMTLYAVIPMIFFPFVVNKLGNLVHKYHMRIQEQFSSLTASVQENLAGVRVVKAYRQEENESTFMDSMFEKSRLLNMDMVRLQSVFFPLLTFMAAALNLVVFYVGGKAVMSGELSLGTVVAFFAYLNMLFWPLFALGWVVSLYQRGTASLDRINQILHAESEVKFGEKGLYTGPVRGKIEFRDLTFGYDKSHPILKHITLTIESGETIGIVGPTASGKTTLVSLLSRLYQAERGQIFVDGVDINDWDLDALRKGIGFAAQEPFLFSDTIAFNIRFGNESATDEQIASNAHAAAISKDIETFPNRYDTIIGERGITLSGGQRQRTAIARATLINPAILILDDATSAVDTETEDQINHRIKELAEHRTAIIISHRISSVKDADRIIYLEEGKIAEIGTHEDLIHSRGKYADLYQSQLLQEELERL